MPPSQRLRLASLIPSGLITAPAQDIDQSMEWSDEDLADLSAATWNHIARQTREPNA